MSDNPKRIQRRRTLGWRMPDGTKYVGRPSIWGNPFIVGQRFRNLALYVCIVGQIDQPEIDQWTGLWYGLTIPTPQVAARWFEWYARWRINEANDDHWLDPLRGKDLACWCREDEPFCHGDVLLRLANQKVEVRDERDNL